MNAKIQLKWVFECLRNDRKHCKGFSSYLYDFYGFFYHVSKPWKIKISPYGWPIWNVLQEGPKVHINNSKSFSISPRKQWTNRSCFISKTRRLQCKNGNNQITLTISSSAISWLKHIKVCVFSAIRNINLLVEIEVKTSRTFNIVQHWHHSLK